MTCGRVFKVRFDFNRQPTSVVDQHWNRFAEHQKRLALAEVCAFHIVRYYNQGAKSDPKSAAIVSLQVCGDSDGSSASVDATIASRLGECRDAIERRVTSKDSDRRVVIHCAFRPPIVGPARCRFIHHFLVRLRACVLRSVDRARPTASRDNKAMTAVGGDRPSDIEENKNAQTPIRGARSTKHSPAFVGRWNWSARILVRHHCAT